MARFDGELTAAGTGSIELDELVQLLSGARVSERDRNDAIACFLSTSEGWRDARTALGGTFAALSTATGLTGGKEK